MGYTFDQLPRALQQQVLRGESGKGRQELFDSISEAQLQRMVIEEAKRLGWGKPISRDDMPANYCLIYHTHDSRKSAWGFPDLVLCHVGQLRVLYVEVKREGEKPDPFQLAWHESLLACGQESYVWFPHDYEAILEVLRAKPA